MKVNILKYLIVLLTFNFLSAQLSTGIESTYEFSDNMFRLPNKEKSSLLSMSFGVENYFGKLGVGYYGNYNNFSKFENRNYYWQQIGLWYADTSYIIGAYFVNRNNKDDYNFLNYSSFTTYGRNEIGLENISFNTSLSISYTSYTNLSEYNNFLLTSYFNATKSFDTKTTIIAGINSSYKAYSENIVYNNEKISPYLLQFGFTGRIAQGIDDNTGLAIQYSFKKIVSGEGKEIRQNEFSYGDESDLFDDPYSVSGSDVTMELIHLLDESITISLSCYYSDEEYQTQGIYLNEEDYNFLVKRKDKNFIVSVGIEKSFEIEFLSTSLLTLGISYDYIDSESNSYWFNYNSNNFEFSISYQF